MELTARVRLEDGLTGPTSQDCRESLQRLDTLDELFASLAEGVKFCLGDDRDQGGTELHVARATPSEDPFSA